MKYSLEDFQNIYENNSQLLNLDEEAKTIIENLCLDLNISYNKAFVKKTFKKKKNNDIDEWESIRNFKVTEFNKNHTESENMQNCRKYFNMLTKNNFDNLSEKILNEIEYIFQNKTQNDFYNTCENLFVLIYNNTLYSDLYSKLFIILNQKYNYFNVVLNKYLDNFIEKINTINYIDPQTDYTIFCENNKNNDIIRSQTILYCNLVKESLFKVDKLIPSIDFIIDKIKDNLSKPNLKKEIEEYSEIVYILISQLYFYFDDNYKNNINNIVNEICNYKNVDYPSYSSKTLFKFMDIKEECKIN